MTAHDYSLSGLQDLLNDLESLTLSLVNLPSEHVSQDAFNQLHQSQLDLVERAQSYALRARACSQEGEAIRSQL